jgi:hypothetical protein
MFEISFKYDCRVALHVVRILPEEANIASTDVSFRESFARSATMLSVSDGPRTLRMSAIGNMSRTTLDFESIICDLRAYCLISTETEANMVLRQCESPVWAMLMEAC